ncbi:MAG: metalloregulator ArsR/SmtB family transcription factor [Campylobacterota bacterium]|nr:metalloregulator ArsR/SmtB family transcription factor [Campylobacterota bacterium]
MDVFLETVGALKDETRVKLLKFLQKNGKMCVCDLESAFGMIQSRLSRHLKILKDAGFLKVERTGRWAFYGIRSPLDRFRTEALNEIETLDIELPEFTSGCKKD